MKMYRPHRLCPRNSKPKEPSLYRSLCVSILCMFLSTVMLVGTTMAWFSDSLQTGVYTITSANFSSTVYYCTELSSEANTPNNWQRLNPSNTTLFGGGSLSSNDGQVAYLKLVSNSGMPLKYKFTLTASEENGNIDNLSLAGCQRAKINETEEDLSESNLKGIDLSAITPGSDSKTVVFDVPAATEGNTPATVYAVLKLTCSSTEQTTYKFSLKLEIIQDKEGAGVTESNSPTTNTEFTMEIGGTPPTPAPTAPIVSDSSGEGAQQPDDGNNSGGNHTETPSGSTTETKNPTETPESGNGGNAGTTGTTGTTSDTSGTSGGTGAPVSEPQAEVPTT